MLCIGSVKSHLYEIAVRVEENGGFNNNIALVENFELYVNSVENQN